MHRIDPDSLLEITGTVRRFIPNTHGDLDGLLFDDGTEIHFPPHLSTTVAGKVKAGDLIGVRAVRPRNANVWRALAIQPTSGKRIEDVGPEHSKGGAKKKQPKKMRALPPLEIKGVVEMVLHNGHGEAHGLLLRDGFLLRFDPQAADDLAAFLAPGTNLCASGKHLKTRWGDVLDTDFFWAAENAPMA